MILSLQEIGAMNTMMKNDELVLNKKNKKIHDYCSLPYLTPSASASNSSVKICFHILDLDTYLLYILHVMYLVAMYHQRQRETLGLSPHLRTPISLFPLMLQIIAFWGITSFLQLSLSNYMVGCWPSKKWAFMVLTTNFLALHYLEKCQKDLAIASMPTQTDLAG